MTGFLARYERGTQAITTSSSYDLETGFTRGRLPLPRDPTPHQC